MGIHTALTHCIATHFFSFFPAIPTTEHGERSRVRAEKPHSEAAQDFFRSELAKPLTASECGVTFADRKEKKSFVVVMPFCGYDKHIHDIFINFINKPILLVHFP